MISLYLTPDGVEMIGKFSDLMSPMRISYNRIVHFPLRLLFGQF
jgi:hypothetical protein